MLIFKGKLDPLIKLKLKEKTDRAMPTILLLKEPLNNRLKNIISKNSGKLKHEYKYINAVAADLKIEEVDKLSERPEILNICYDRKASICMDKASAFVGLNYKSPYNLTGRSINIGIIDTGVYPHPDLWRPSKMILYFKDFVNSIQEPYDDNGHGTHLCGTISGSGSLSEGKYRGIAPNSKIVMLKAFNNVGEGAFSDIIAAIDWTIENKDKYSLKILCLPFGADPIVPSNIDPLCKICEIAYKNKLIIVAASGNKGSQEGTVTTPGISPYVLTAGCCECASSNVIDWKITNFSSRGAKKNKDIKPDFIAPGTNIVSLSSDKSYLPLDVKKRLMQKSLESPYFSMTGSSVSSAIATACVALLLEKIPNISFEDLKAILKLSCVTLNEPKTSQGFGVINMEKLLNK